MSNKKMNVRLVNKHDLEQNWRLAENFIPLSGEVIIYDAENSESQLLDKKLNDGTKFRTNIISYPRVKIGNNIDYVNDLPFVVPDISLLPTIHSGTEDPRLMEDFGKDGDIYIMYSEE